MPPQQIDCSHAQLSDAHTCTAGLARSRIRAVLAHDQWIPRCTTSHTCDTCATMASKIPKVSQLLLTHTRGNRCQVRGHATVTTLHMDADSCGRRRPRACTLCWVARASMFSARLRTHVCLIDACLCGRRVCRSLRPEAERHSGQKASASPAANTCAAGRAAPRPWPHTPCFPHSLSPCAR